MPTWFKVWIGFIICVALVGAFVAGHFIVKYW